VLNPRQSPFANQPIKTTVSSGHICHTCAAVFSWKGSLALIWTVPGNPAALRSFFFTPAECLACNWLGATSVMVLFLRMGRGQPG
jgi:hypothetical protein